MRNNTRYVYELHEFIKVPVREYKGTLNDLSDVIGYSPSSIYNSYIIGSFFGDLYKTSERSMKTRRTYIYKVIEHERKVIKVHKGSIHELSKVSGVGRYELYHAFIDGRIIGGRFEIYRREK